MSDSALAYETAAARAAEAGLRKTQIGGLGSSGRSGLVSRSPARHDICEQAVEESRAHGDPLLLAQTQLATACFRLLYDTWRNQDAETLRFRPTHHPASQRPEYTGKHVLRVRAGNARRL